jgi:YhcH/YjgK/YiaL family protein
MILDHLANASLYFNLHPHPRIARALQALGDPGFLAKAPGRYELEGEKLFAMIQEYVTKPAEQGRWEAHRRYIDVQFVAAGVEVIGYAPLPELQVVDPYDAEKDVMFLQGTGSLLRVDAGMFAVFYPHDAHMPMLAVSAPQMVRKIVLKVLAE